MVPTRSDDELAKQIDISIAPNSIENNGQELAEIIERDSLSKTSESSKESLSQIRDWKAVRKRVQRIGRYTILEELGIGGIGVIYKAFDPKLKRLVALKVVQVSDCAKDLPEHVRLLSRGRMLEEAKAMAKLSHPNIVPIFDVGTTDDGIFLTMEFVVGRSLRSWLDTQQGDWNQAVNIVWQAGQGLWAIHRAGFVHRNFNPENIMVGKDGRAKLLDFGLAVEDDRFDDKRIDCYDSERSHSQKKPASQSATDLIKSTRGTPGYIAPEQYKGKKSDERSDQFAFAIVLFEVIYGRRPFSSTIVVQAQLDQELELKFPSRRPKWTRSVLQRALAYDAEQRYSNLKDLLTEIEGNLNSRSKFWIVLGLTTAILIGIAQLVWFLLDRSSACDPAGSNIDRIWDSRQKQEAESKFLESPQRFAADTWHKSSARLDDYKKQWSSTYQETCQQLRANSNDQSALLDRQMQCLARRLEQFQALTDLFEHASSSVVEHAISASLQLKSVAECKDPEINVESFSLPLDPLNRAAILALQRRFDSVRILTFAGKMDEAATSAQENLEQAERLAFPPLVIDAHSSYADVLVQQWEFQRALPIQHRALALALSIDDSIRAAELIGDLVLSQSVVSPNLASLKDLIGWAKALVQRAGQNSAVRVEVLNSIGNVYFNFEEFSEAKVAYLEGLTIPGGSKLHRAFLMMNLGQCELMERRLDEAQVHLEASRAEIGEVYGENHPQLSHVESLLGSLAYFRGHGREALAYLDQAILLSTQDDGKVSYHALPAYSHRGLSLRNIGRIQDAIINAQIQVQADSELSGPSHPRICGDLYRLGHFSQLIGDRSKSRRALLELEALANEFPEDERCRMGALWSRAFALLHDRQFEAAQIQLEIAESMAGTIRDTRDFEEKRIELHSELLEADGQLLQAKVVIEEFINELEDASWMSLATHSRMLLRLASVERQLEHFDEALVRLKRAENQLVTIAGVDSLRQAEVDLIRGKILLDQKLWVQAQDTFRHGLSRSEEDQSSPILIADLEFHVAQALYSAGEDSHEIAELAKKAQQRLKGRFDPSHPRVQRIQEFLASCCSRM